MNATRPYQRSGHIYFRIVQNGRTAEAMPLVAQMLRLNSTHPVIRYHAGVILGKSGDIQRGNNLVKDAIQPNLGVFTAYIAESKAQ
jgi:hypothetical protein